MNGHCSPLSLCRASARALLLLLSPLLLPLSPVLHGPTGPACNSRRARCCLIIINSQQPACTAQQSAPAHACARDAAAASGPGRTAECSEYALP